ncbi:MAG: hypothetical protein V4710_02380 [Verrucomicrobiota bacterium]
MRRILIVLLTLATLGIAALICIFRTSPPVVVLHTASVAWLPPSAKDVSSYETEGFGWRRSYECTLSEAEFRTFAASKGWPLKEAKNVFPPRIPGLPALRTVKDFEEPINLIPEALALDNASHSGGAMIVIFDRELSRMFYLQSHR